MSPSRHYQSKIFEGIPLRVGLTSHLGAIFKSSTFDIDWTENTEDIQECISYSVGGEGSSTAAAASEHVLV